MRIPTSVAAIAVVVATALALSMAAPGCGPGAPEVDKAALYSPESLAQELAVRYRNLKPDARKASRRAAPTSSKAPHLNPAPEAKTKAQGKDDVAKKAPGTQPTLDEVLDDISAKINRVPKTTRIEVCREMIEALSKDGSLSAEDRAMLTDRLKEMGGD